MFSLTETLFDSPTRLLTPLKRKNFRCLSRCDHSPNSHRAHPVVVALSLSSIRDLRSLPALPLNLQIQPLRLDSGLEAFRCPLCFPDRAPANCTPIAGRKALTEHLRWHQNQEQQAEGRFACCYCAKELSSYSSLDRHLLTHTSESLEAPGSSPALSGQFFTTFSFYCRLSAVRLYAVQARLHNQRQLEPTREDESSGHEDWGVDGHAR